MVFNLFVLGTRCPFYANNDEIKFSSADMLHRLFKEVKVLPNIKSAKKRVLITAEHRAINVSRSSALKTSLKKVTTAINAKDATTAKANYQEAIKSLDSSARKGVIHKNQAARRKSRLAKKINAMAQ